MLHWPPAITLCIVGFWRSSFVLHKQCDLPLLWRKCTHTNFFSGSLLAVKTTRLQIFLRKSPTNILPCGESSPGPRSMVFGSQNHTCLRQPPVVLSKGWGWGWGEGAGSSSWTERRARAGPGAGPAAGGALGSMGHTCWKLPCRRAFHSTGQFLTPCALKTQSKN